MGLGLKRRMEHAAQSTALLRRLLTQARLGWNALATRRHRHPLDRRYGTHTSGMLPLYLLRPGTPADDHMIIYVGCVPSALRTMLDTIGGLADYNFLDLGCGLGRALIVASEYPFLSIVGIELNPDLVRGARSNARRIARIAPARTSIDVRLGDASIPVLPHGNTIIFLYHLFGSALVGRLVRSLRSQVQRGDHVFVIYANPVHGRALDADPGFTRWASVKLPCDEEESGHGFDRHENIVVWKTGLGNGSSSPHLRDLRIVTTIPDHKVELAS